MAKLNMHRRIASVTAIVSIFLFATVIKAKEAKTQPNIVIVMLDDLGYSDLGCYGGEVRTPNIDLLAENGLRFTQFYNAARCCPTRAALLTGLYPHQVGLASNGRSLTRDGVTIAEVLKTKGYQTAIAGKWHLSFTPSLGKEHLKWVNHQLDPDRPFAPLDTYPVNRGFDNHYGIIWGVIDYFDPFSLVDGEKAVKEVDDDYYITDAITDHSVEYIDTMSKSEKPFFLYVAHCAPHWPLQARQEDIARYRDTYKDGWNALRNRRYKRQLEMGLIDPETHPLPKLMGHGPDWSQLKKEDREWEANNMAVHAAMVDRVDQGVGRIIAALKKAGQYENTAIFVLADNGASPERPGGPGYDRPSFTRDGKAVKYGRRAIAGEHTSWGGISGWWANAANTPFRYWKKESFEGGCHTPLIVHWPKGLKTKAGGQTDQLGHVIDMMPTVLEITGAKYPKRYNDHDIRPAEGRSLLPILLDEVREGHPSLFFEHARGRAFRQGDWKLVASSRSTTKWELYNIAKDRTELNDLAASHPARVKAMAEQWHQTYQRLRAVKTK